MGAEGIPGLIVIWSIWEGFKLVRDASNSNAGVNPYTNEALNKCQFFQGAGGGITKSGNNYAKQDRTLYMVTQDDGGDDDDDDDN